MSEPVTLFRHVDRVEPNRRAITLYDTVLPRPPWTGTITEGRWLPAEEFATLTRERDEAAARANTATVAANLMRAERDAARTALAEARKYAKRLPFDLIKRIDALVGGEAKS